MRNAIERDVTAACTPTGGDPPRAGARVAVAAVVRPVVRSAVNLLTDPKGRRLVGEGNKNGNYYALDANTMKPAWTDHVGPGSSAGAREAHPESLFVLCAGTEQLCAETLRTGGNVAELEDVFIHTAEAVLLGATPHHEET